MNGRRVLVGMSGGVDSSVAAWLLKRDGWDVIGVTMKVWPQDCLSRAEDKCCGPSAIADARAVAHRLGVPHYVVDESDNFQKIVIEYFAGEYRAGRTPNPCVMCNEHLKFGNLRTKARALGAEFVATGHYAIIERHAGRAVLRKGSDPRKDQSYFLFSLGQDQLLHAMMPLGGMTKPEIRETARGLGLKVADKADSQEICFVPGNDYRAFLRGRLGEFHRGGIYDTAGNFLGDHEGIEMFTIGQRKGLPGGAPHPRYVVDIDPATSRVIVGSEEELVRDAFEVDRVTWHDGEPDRPLRAVVKIRYAHPGAAASVEALPGHRAKILLDEPQRAVTPGQAAVFYDGDRVVGGGWILRKSI
ncbi:MAG: tRNA 2-thiouridine(34) synthase MnmA [Verrucomicrobiae bacterium]